MTARHAGARRALAAVLLLLVLGWLVVASRRSFDRAAHLAAARAVVTAPDVVTHRLRGGAGRAGAGTFQFRPSVWLSVVTLRGMPPTSGHRRYLVWLGNAGGWTLAGAAVVGSSGDAQVRSGAEPNPLSVSGVLVTLDRDTAATQPHGTVVLRWYDPARTRAGSLARL